MGAFQYMAPKQLEGKGANARSDIFSFGCVLYEMATGKRAFFRSEPVVGENRALPIALVENRSAELDK